MSHPETLLRAPAGRTCRITLQEEILEMRQMNRHPISVVRHQDLEIPSAPICERKEDRMLPVLQRMCNNLLNIPCCSQLQINEISRILTTPYPDVV
ncbi:hypothetical protein CDAR_552041 [Caerostris darwini]|uniref:Uncharacterized protein n=1 Tax=Caerostris darwini TaxID=1538125 RepID=A0AAV4PEC4_9ARAC|nr:hypothetical protein CDAR_552041 [Caerostris darwini]